MFIKEILLLLIVTWNFHKTRACGEIDIKCENDTCTKCYKTLAMELLQNADNYIALQKTFFPPDNNGPDFVIVTYNYTYNLSESAPATQMLTNQVWFWSTSAYFFYHPLRVFQCTSLGFSDPSLKQRSITLYLPATCYENSNMKLLTQRLKLFAMHQKITGQIDSTYTAQSHSLDTLKDWHNQHSQVSILILLSQVIFPILACIFFILYFVYLIESEPINLGKKLNSQTGKKSPSEIRKAARSKVWIIVNINIIFTLGTIAADIAATVEYKRLPKEIENYINDHSKAFIYLHTIPFIMLGFDILSFALFILIPAMVVRWKDYDCCRNKYKVQCSDFMYTTLSPLSCIGTHSYHIIFAFINNPYHATSVLLIYTMTLFVVVVIFQKLYYLALNNYYLLQKFSDSSKCNQCCRVCIKWGYIVISYLLTVSAMLMCIGLTVAVLLLLPLNNAIDEASNDIYAIYQASVTVFAALITFQVFFRRTNSMYTVLIKAADKFGESSRSETWKEMSEKEKELYLGDALLTHIQFKPPAQELEDHAS